jgi:hypothetical protein
MFGAVEVTSAAVKINPEPPGPEEAADALLY